MAANGHFASATLYVGDLHRDVTEALLYEVFNSIGPVASIRVCRDSTSRRSLGYAYVNYHTVGDAERALDNLNYTHIRNIPCRLMWSQRDPALRKSGTGNIFVKNLDKNIDNKALYDTFSLFGNILSCKVSQDEVGKSRGFGFVHYETEESAERAIDKVNGMQIGTKTVYVGPFQKKNDRSCNTEEIYTNVYVKNVPASWDDEKMKDVFGEFGEVTSVALQRDNRDRLYGFVNFEKIEDARAAVESLHNKKIGDDGLIMEENKEAGEEEESEQAATEKEDEEETSPTVSRLYVSRFQPRSERNALLRAKFDQTDEQRQKKLGVNLYIKNIHDSVDDKALREMFEKFGTITSARVMRDEASGVSKGFGFVSFLSPEEGTRAVTEMHLKLVEKKPLYVGLHEKREARVDRLQHILRLPGRTRKPQTSPFGGQGGSPMYVNGAVIPNQQYSGVPNRGSYGNFMSTLPAGGQWSRGPGRHSPAANMPLYPAANAAVGNRNVRPTKIPQIPPHATTGGFVDVLNPQMLAAAPSHVQKQVLGERLFPRIKQLQPSLAGKITGMMLDMDNTELLLLLQSDYHLRSKVDEALRVLHQASSTEVSAEVEA